MLARNSSWSFFLALLLCVSRASGAQEPGVPASPQDAAPGQERLREQLRERWRDRPSEQKETLARRLAELERDRKSVV